MIEHQSLHRIEYDQGQLVLDINDQLLRIFIFSASTCSTAGVVNVEAIKNKAESKWEDMGLAL